MDDESGAAEAVEAAESDGADEATAEAAREIDARLTHLEGQLAGALDSAAGAAEGTAQLGREVRAVHDRIDELAARIDELAVTAGDIVLADLELIGSAHGDVEPLAPTDDGSVACRVCGRLAAEGADMCPRCGAALGEAIA